MTRQKRVVGMNHALTQRMKLIWQIFGVFFKIGPSTFGGGYAMLATIEQEIVCKKGWMTREKMGDMVSISGSAPGGVAVNSAAFIAHVGIILPSLIIVIVITAFFLRCKTMTGLNRRFTVYVRLLPV